MNKRKENLILFAMIGCYFVIMIVLVLVKYFNFNYNAIDLAIFNNVLFNSVKGNLFFSSIQNNLYFADHFAPILFLIMPDYWIFKSPVLLLTLQTLMIGLAAWPLYLIARDKLKFNWAILVAGLFLPLLFVPVTGVLFLIAKYGFMINTWLALFNMIPFGMFDGKKVLAWSKPVYFIILAVGLFFMGMQGVLF